MNDTINGQKVKITQLEADVAQLEKVAEQEAQTKLEFEKLQKRNTEFKVLMDDLRNQKRNLQSQCDQKDLVLAKERENREREKRKEREEREVREEKEKEKRKEDERLQKERLEERAKDRCEIWKLRGLIEELKANVPLPSGFFFFFFFFIFDQVVVDISSFNLTKKRCVCFFRWRPSKGRKSI